MCAMPNININIQQPQELCKIKPFALIKLFLHSYRFWNEFGKDSKYAYGILVGKHSGDTRIVEKIVPILHSDHSEAVFDEEFYKHWDDLNELEEELESGLFNIGWYKVIEMSPMKFRARDIRNQVKIQTEDPNAIALLLNPESFLKNEGYGFSIFRLEKGMSSHLHEMCEHRKIPWEISELGNDVDKTVNLIIELIDKYDTEKPYIEEIDEAEVPDTGGYDWDEDDDGGYVTPDIDPNQQPGFF